MTTWGKKEGKKKKTSIRDVEDQFEKRDFL